MSGIARLEFVKAKKLAEAAAHDEQLTRHRVEMLEKRQSNTEALLSRPFLGRLRWLFQGR